MNKFTAFLVKAVSFIFAFAVGFLFCVSLINCLKNFIIVGDRLSAAIIFIASLVIAIITTVFVSKSIKGKGTKLSFFLGQKLPKILSTVFILILLFSSVKNQLTWQGEEVKDVLSLQWTIFGISIAIFVVWNVLIIDFFKKNQPVLNENMDGREKYKALLDKYYISHDIETSFLTVIILTINLILLLVSTGLVYINGRVESIVTQTMVLSSFYFTTNSLLALFIDFLNPLLKAKRDLIKNNRVSKQDLDNAEKEAKEQEAIEVITKIIESKDFDKYSKEEKEALVKKCFNTDKN